MDLPPWLFKAKASRVLGLLLPVTELTGGWLDFTGSMCAENDKAIQELGRRLDTDLPFNPVAITIGCGRESHGYETKFSGPGISHARGRDLRLQYLEDQCTSAAKGKWVSHRRLEYTSPGGSRFLTTIGDIVRD